MGWIRKGSGLVRIDPLGTAADLLSEGDGTYRLLVGVEDDAAVSFAHDFKELLNKYLVRGKLVASARDGLHPHEIAVLGELLAFIGDYPGDKETYINFDVTPLITVRAAEGDKHVFIKATERGLIKAVDVPVRDFEDKGDSGSEL